MVSTTRTAALVGLLDLISTGTFYAADTLIAGALDGADSLAGAAVAGNALTVAALAPHPYTA